MFLRQTSKPKIINFFFDKEEIDYMIKGAPIGTLDWLIYDRNLSEEGDGCVFYFWFGPKVPEFCSAILREHKTLDKLYVNASSPHVLDIQAPIKTELVELNETPMVKVSVPVVTSFEAQESVKPIVGGNALPRKPMPKIKIPVDRELRKFCLSLAANSLQGNNLVKNSLDIISRARIFEAYIQGD